MRRRSECICCTEVVSNLHEAVKPCRDVNRHNCHVLRNRIGVSHRRAKNRVSIGASKRSLLKKITPTEEHRAFTAVRKERDVMSKSEPLSYNTNLRAEIKSEVNEKPKARVHSKEWQKIQNGDPVEINPSVGHGYKVTTYYI